MTRPATRLIRGVNVGLVAFCADNGTPAAVAVAVAVARGAPEARCDDDDEGIAGDNTGGSISPFNTLTFLRLCFMGPRRLLELRLFLGIVSAYLPMNDPE